ncbi:MAG TPA: GAF domain-containing protein [Solirubrobacteraceae bacterium]|nr:GAF domain-containing protein [Solirubrobacteraceae bacterium]
MRDRPDDEKLRRLLNLELALESESDSERALRLVLQEARAITCARYAALGVLDEDRAELERFLALGVDAATERAIGRLPRGRGVLGVLIADPRPLRLAEIAQHPDSYGFPPGHPPMRSFLGVPIMIDGEPIGNLYVADKEGGAEFTEADEHAAVRLAHVAARAIERERA